MVLRLSEIYTSVQGEGPRVGIPTTFVRFGGCNLRCPGWACDTPYAIFPKHRKEWRVVTVQELMDEYRKVGDDVENVCVTGGEPLLQQNVQLFEFFDALIHIGGKEVEVFTNGTMRITYPLASYIVDWKLPGSGEDPDNRTRIENVEFLAELNRKGTVPSSAVKFVIAHRDDFGLAVRLWKKYLQDTPLQTFYGAVWENGVSSEQLVNWVLEYSLPWRLNLQTHKFVFGDIRGI